MPDSSVPDYGRAASDYARHRQGFPQHLIDDLVSRGIGTLGQTVLDICSGTGLMARAMARLGCQVTALDPSADMLQQARVAALSAGLGIDHVQARAEETGLPDSGFDVITAATCWHWFDRPVAAKECLRLLRPGGRLVIAHQDWLRRPGNVIDLTLHTIERWNAPPADRKWTFQYPEWLFDLTDAGFGDYRLLGFPADLDYTHQAWVGRIVASAQIGPALTLAQQDAFRLEFAALLADHFPDPMPVAHRIFAIILDRP